jgi:hypothetical protein
MKQTLRDTFTERNIISLSLLQVNQADYVDQEVAVATFLFTHEEGPWIQDIPIVKAMSLVVTEKSKLVPKNPAKFRWWFEYQEGYPVVISGVFRVGRWKRGHTGEIVENYPYIEVSEAREVGDDDPVWKAHATNGEQTDSSDGDKPPN